MLTHELVNCSDLEDAVPSAIIVDIADFAASYS
jgi:hypothetical protein